MHPDDLIGSTEEERRLYGLIWQQYISCQMPDAEYLSTSVKVEVGEYYFSAKGREVVFDGYTKISKNNTDAEDDILPVMHEGEDLDSGRTKLRSEIYKATCKIF